MSAYSIAYSSFNSRTALVAAAAALATMLSPQPALAQEAAGELPEVVVEGASLESARGGGKAKPAQSAAQPSEADGAGKSAKEAASSGGEVAGETQAKPSGAEDTQAGETAGESLGGGQPIDEVGSAVAVVTGRELRARQIRNGADALRSLPGVSVSRTGGFAGLTQVRIRGAEGNQTLVLIDGIEVNDTTNGEFDFSDLSAEDIERIEVVRGPQSGIYGAGAVGGVINIVTRGGRGPLTFTARGEGGSFATKDGAAGVSAGNDKIWGSLSLHTRDSGGFNIAPLGDEQDGAALRTFSARGGAQLLPGLTLDFTLRSINKDGERDTEGAVLGQLQEQTDDPATFRSSILAEGANLTWDTLEGHLTQVVSIADTTTHRVDTTTTFTGDNLGETLRYAYSGTGRLGVRDGLPFATSLTWLVEKQDETFVPNSSFADGIKRGRERLSYAGEWQGEFFDRLFLTADLRHDDNTTFDDFTTWRTTATLKLTELGLRPHGSAGTAVKAPTMFEQYGLLPTFFTPNPDLKPEESFGWDAGLEWATRDRRYVFDVTYFKSDLENAINGLAPGPNFTFTAVNRPGISHREGVEVSAEVALMPGLRLTGAYTYLEALTPDGLDEFRRPRHSGRADLIYTFAGGKGTLSTSAIYNGEQIDATRRVTGFFFGFPVLEPERTTLDDYVVVNVAASYKVEPGVELFGRIENLFDENYHEVYGFETAGIAAYAGVKVRFEEPASRAWAEGR